MAAPPAVPAADVRDLLLVAEALNAAHRSLILIARHMSANGDPETPKLLDELDTMGKSLKAMVNRLEQRVGS